MNRDAGPTDRLDAVFDVLRDSRRRYLLYHLTDADDGVFSLEELVQAVREYEADGDDRPPRQAVRTSLVHDHLPRLGDLDVLEHDPRHGTVRFHGAGLLDGWLDRTRQVELD